MSTDIIEHTEQIPIHEATLASSIARVEIDTLIATARQYPRSIARAVRNMTDMATIDELAADECVYSLPRKGTAIEGPSIRFAELAAQSWGNCRVAARTTVIDRAEKYVEAEGFFLDAETNVATLARIRRRIVDRYGKVYNDDMIMMTCNAAQSIARRNAVLAGIPKQAWRKPYEAARQTIMGDFKTLANRRAEAIKSFQRFGLTEAQVLALMGVQGIEDISQEKLVPLRGMYSSLHNQDITVEELLRQIEPDKPQRVTAATAKMEAPAQFASDGLPSVDAAPAKPAASPPAAATAPTEVHAAPVQSQPALALEPDADEDGDAVLDQIGEMLSKVKTLPALDKVWKGLAHLLDGEPERKAKAEALHTAAVERLTPKKQAAE